MPELLVVDDEEDLREAIGFIFESINFKVDTASNGEQALELIKNKSYDVVLSDVKMPNGDGLWLLQKIRELHPIYPPVFLITGYADITLLRAYEMGAEAVFAKPFDRKQLVNSVKAVLNTSNFDSSRKGIRIAVDMPVSLKIEGIANNVEGTIKNVSKVGMYIEFSDVESQQGTQCSFQVKIENLKKIINGEGLVKWTNKTETGKIGAGIEFTYKDAANKADIVLFLNFLRTSLLFTDF